MLLNLCVVPEWLGRCLQIFLIVVLLANGYQASQVHELSVCEQQYVSIDCPADHVILVYEASYGRMTINDCVSGNFGYIGCKDDVTDVLHKHCTGRETCEFLVLKELFPDTQSCHSDLKAFLRLFYTCVTVENGEESDCGHVSSQTGFLSSVVAAETGCGTVASPWHLEARPGQVITVTPGNSSSSRQLDSCVTVREVGESTVQQVCDTYNSHVSKITLWFNKHTVTHFLTSYKIWGCPDPDDPAGGVVERSGNQAHFRCDSGLVWTHTCDGSHWIGDMLNCTAESFEESSSVLMTLPIGVIIVIVLALAIVIGLLVLTIGLYLMKRRHVYSSSGTEASIMLQNHKAVPAYDVYNKPAGNWEYGHCMVHGNTEYEYGTVYCGHRDYIQSPDILQPEKQPLNSTTESAPDDPRTRTLLPQRTHSSPENLSQGMSPRLVNREHRREPTAQTEHHNDPATTVLNENMKANVSSSQHQSCDICSENNTRENNLTLQTFKPALPQL